MKGEDKIFLLCALYAGIGGEKTQEERLDDLVSTYTKTEINEQLLKFQEMEKHE
jgi:hypothetical protein